MSRPRLSMVIKVAAVFWLTSLALAQVQVKKPVPYERKDAPERREAPPGLQYSLGRAAVSGLSQPSSAETAVMSRQQDPPLVGINRDVPSEAVSAGRWAQLPDGSAVWRWTLRSPDASGVRVWIENFSAGQGKLWVYSEGGTAEAVDGPFSGLGPYDDGRFWTATVPGDSVTLEFVPDGGQPMDTVPFQVRRLGHLFQDVAAAATAAAPAAQLRSLAPAEQNTITVGPLAAADGAELCNIDVNCYAQWNNTAKSVALMLIATPEGQASCTGTLLATRNNSLKPYFLTANHCVNTEEEARSVELYWAYQSSTCRGPAPTDKGSARSTGASLLYGLGLGAGDQSLLLLKGIPSGVVFSGWDAGEPGVGSHFTVIHHPAGSYKRIAMGTRTGDAPVEIGPDVLAAGGFYQIELDLGIAQPGSSGSGGFTSDGILASVLSNGPASSPLCNERPITIGMGRFSVMYPNISDYMEDLPFTAVTPSVTTVEFRVANGFLTSASPQRVTVTTQSANPVPFSVRPDAVWVKLSASGGSTSVSAPGSFQISVDPGFFKKPGDYTTTVTLTSGSAPPQFVNVVVHVTADRSEVVMSIAPNPVLASGTDANGARWAFKIRLEEITGRTATRVTTLRINAVDYSARIADWFGSDRLAPGGLLEATLHAANLSVPTEIVFETGGTDETTGQTWYRTLSVPFR